MFDGKFICTLAAIIVAVLTICNFDKKENIVIENFANGIQGGVKMMSSTMGENGKLVGDRTANVGAVMQPGAAYGTTSAVMSLTNGSASPMGRTTISSEGLQTPPSMQAMLSPRGSAESFSLGSRIRYNMPANRNLAYEQNNHHDIVTESYTHETGCRAASTSFHTDKFGEPDSGYTNGNWQDVHNTLPSNPNVQNNELLSNSLPVPTMTEASAGNVEGYENENVVNYNQLMISLPKSRNTGHGCPIRGDVYVTPNSGCWFQTSLKPDSLQQGAMAVLGGTEAVPEATARWKGATAQPTAGGMGLMSGGTPNVEALTQMNALSDVNVTLLPHA
jgi:hypothetical protein